MVIRIAAAEAGPAGRSRMALQFALEALRSGNPTKAEMLLRDRLAEDASDPHALAMLAEIAVDQRRFEETTMLLRRAVAVDPSPERRLQLIHHLQDFDSPAVVLNEIDALPAEARTEFEIRAIESAASGQLGMHDRQIAIYEELTRKRPVRPKVLSSLANALRTVGRTDEGVAILRRAMKAHPTSGEAYWTLANFKSFRFSDRDIAGMRNALRRKLPEPDAIHIHFALGRALEDRGEFELSFRHYALGNRIKAGGFDITEAVFSGFVDDAVAKFDAGFFERNRGAGCDEQGPIFVIGMHRAGSTLIEQILASHPLVEGTTELSVMNHIRDRLARQRGGSDDPFDDACEAIARLDRTEFAKIGAEYLARSRSFRRTDRPFFVDKMPANWMNIALIRLALPNAKIIDARRHPLACGFSNFKQHYAHGVVYSYGLQTMGLFYRDYWRFMRHINAVEPGAVHRVINERLIDEPEREIRRLLDFAELPFDAACLRSHDTERAIRTPSAEQVRRPINRDGMDVWRNYEPWLDPLKQALGPALEAWEE